MSKRKIVVKPVKKSDRLKKYIFTVLQALSGALIVGTIFIYSIISTMNSPDTIDAVYRPSIGEFRGDYYESYLFTTNFEKSVSEILRYAVIRQQLEDAGEYSPKKVIYVGQFAHRNDSVEYSGPDAPYYLDDLIEWGKSGIERDYKVFFSWEEYYDFIGGKTYTHETGNDSAGSEVFITDSSVVYTESVSDSVETTIEVQEDYDELDFYGYNMSLTAAEPSLKTSEKTVASLDTIRNQYLSTEGKALEAYVDNSEDYNELAECLRTTIEDLNSNYDEYCEFKNIYDENNTNVRYAVLIPNGRHFKIFTNYSDIPVSASESKIESIMKEFGYYVYINQKTQGVETNTEVNRSMISYLINDRYAYAYPQGAKMFISIDTDYPVTDGYSSNYENFYKVCKLIPWMVFVCAISLISFIAIGSWLVMHEKKEYSQKGAKDTLKDFDKLPIEISILFFAMLILILLIGESLIVKSVRDIPTTNLRNLYFIPITALTAIDLFVVLLFFYGFVRRIVCHNVYEGSLASMLAPKFDVIKKKFQSTSMDLYDDSEIVLKVGLGYIMFLVMNAFFVSQIIWGRHQGLFIFLLIVFDFLVGTMIFRINIERKKIIDGIKRINEGEYSYSIDSDTMHGDNKRIAHEVNHIGSSISKAVEMSTKDEKLKADLITNVSHDIKTPLTSIINYVNLLKNENIDNENAKRYIEVLEEKSGRLKQLTIDLVEASKITSGNITLEFMKINFVELLLQTVGEFEEKFDEHGLQVVTNLPKEPVYIEADPRRMWRVIENLFNNICKYALENTRVYIDLVVSDDIDEIKRMAVSIKNVSKNELNIPADELTERFIRGDVSRSTEGSGLGLSIAKSLTTAQHGKFDIYLDGDLFKVTLSFDIYNDLDSEKA